MESPLLYNEIEDDKLKSQFDQLIDSINSINANSSEEEKGALNERIQSEVTVKPILAKIIKNEAHGSVCFLLYACIACRYEQFHPTIKLLIETNPSALLWHSNTGKSTILNIAADPSHCALMLWIATNYQWVLDHERCLEDLPAFHLLFRYVHRRGTNNDCTAAIIQQFFETYPQGLAQEHEGGYTPLHAVLIGSAECEHDLFTWIADQCPSNMLKRNSRGCTPLHIACRSLARHRGDDSSEICKYLIEQCPESIRVLDNMERLPIHELLQQCQRFRTVKEVVVSLLRAYPESYNMATSRNPLPSPSSVPFIQRIKTLLAEERELKENVAYLREVSGVFQDAVNGTKAPSSLISSTCDSFCNWATVTSVQRLEAKMEQIVTQLQGECNAD